MQVASKLTAIPKGEWARKESSGDEDIEVDCTIDRPPLVPEGDYEVALVRVDKRKNLYGRTKMFLHFQILNAGEHSGAILFMSVNFPENGKFSISSKFLQQWAIAAGQAPRRHDRLSTRVFRNKIFLGRVRTVTKFVHSSRKLMDRDPDTYYSVLDHLIERLVGS